MKKTTDTIQLKLTNEEETRQLLEQHFIGSTFLCVAILLAAGAVIMQVIL